MKLWLNEAFAIFLPLQQFQYALDIEKEKKINKRRRGSRFWMRPLFADTASSVAY